MRLSVTICSGFLVGKIWLSYIASAITFPSPWFPSPYSSWLMWLASPPSLSPQLPCLSRSWPSFNVHLELHPVGHNVTFMGLRHFCLHGLLPSFKKENLKINFTSLLAERNIIHKGVSSNDVFFLLTSKEIQSLSWTPLSIMGLGNSASWSNWIISCPGFLQKNTSPLTY